MNEEEKKEYEELKSLLYTGKISQYGKRKLIDIIEKQQKEIEELKKPKYIIDCKTNEITTLTNDYISKEKIRKLKEHIHKTLDDNGITKGYQLTIDNYFKELLGE